MSIYLIWTACVCVRVACIHARLYLKERVGALLNSLSKINAAYKITLLFLLSLPAFARIEEVRMNGMSETDQVSS